MGNSEMNRNITKDKDYRTYGRRIKLSLKEKTVKYSRLINNMANTQSKQVFFNLLIGFSFFYGL